MLGVNPIRYFAVRPSGFSKKNCHYEAVCTVLEDLLFCTVPVCVQHLTLKTKFYGTLYVRFRADPEKNTKISRIRSIPCC
jgi:hypothetical protein